MEKFRRSIRRWWLNVQYPLKSAHIHDFTHRGWGHNIEKCGNSWACWSTPSLRTGDRMITEKGRFIVSSVEHAFGVRDMVWFTCFNADIEA